MSESVVAQGDIHCHSVWLHFLDNNNVVKLLQRWVPTCWRPDSDVGTIADYNGIVIKRGHDSRDHTYLQLMNYAARKAIQTSFHNRIPYYPYCKEIYDAAVDTKKECLLTHHIPGSTGFRDFLWPCNCLNRKTLPKYLEYNCDRSLHAFLGPSTSLGSNLETWESFPQDTWFIANPLLKYAPKKRSKRKRRREGKRTPLTDRKGYHYGDNKQ